jgi:hypothetical protein
MRTAPLRRRREKREPCSPSLRARTAGSHLRSNWLSPIASTATTLIDAAWDLLVPKDERPSGSVSSSQAGINPIAVREAVKEERPRVAPGDPEFGGKPVGLVGGERLSSWRGPQEATGWPFSLVGVFPSRLSPHRSWAARAPLAASVKPLCYRRGVPRFALSFKADDGGCNDQQVPFRPRSGAKGRAMP